MNHGAVSSAILNAAGNVIQDECLRKAPREGLKFGQMVDSSAGNLTSCRRICHVVLDMWDAGKGVAGNVSRLKF